MNTATFIFTIAAGVLVFVIGQIIQKALIEPIFLQRETIGEIIDSLVFYANVYSNVERPETAPPRYGEASHRLRVHSTNFIARSYKIPWYAFLSWLHIIPSWSDVIKTKHALIGLSNGVTASSDMIQGQIANNLKNVEEIKKALKVNFDL